MDVKKLLDRSKNPFFEHAEAEYFIAEKNGEVVGSAEDFVTDHNYLQRIGTYNTSDVLRYEKQMLTDWFRQRFEAH